MLDFRLNKITKAFNVLNINERLIHREKILINPTSIRKSIMPKPVTSITNKFALFVEALLSATLKKLLATSDLNERLAIINNITQQHYNNLFRDFEKSNSQLIKNVPLRNIIEELNTRIYSLYSETIKLIPLKSDNNLQEINTTLKNSFIKIQQTLNTFLKLSPEQTERNFLNISNITPKSNDFNSKTNKTILQKYQPDIKSTLINNKAFLKPQTSVENKFEVLMEALLSSTLKKILATSDLNERSEIITNLISEKYHNLLKNIENNDEKIKENFILRELLQLLNNKIYSSYFENKKFITPNSSKTSEKADEALKIAFAEIQDLIKTYINLSQELNGKNFVDTLDIIIKKINPKLTSSNIGLNISGLDVLSAHKDRIMTKLGYEIHQLTFYRILNELLTTAIKSAPENSNINLTFFKSTDSENTNKFLISLDHKIKTSELSEQDFSQIEKLLAEYSGILEINSNNTNQRLNAFINLPK